MEDKISKMDLDVHFFLNDEQRHQMDALVLNRCQLQLYTALKHIAELVGEDILIEAAIFPCNLLSPFVCTLHSVPR